MRVQRDADALMARVVEDMQMRLNREVEEKVDRRKAAIRRWGDFEAEFKGRIHVQTDLELSMYILQYTLICKE